jgi:hypothetical protein
MKFFTLVLALAPVGGLAAAVNANSMKEFSAIFGDKKDAMAIMGQLTGMMGESQRKLQVAQRHHKKVVKKIRKDAEAWLQDEAKVYGEYFSEYTAEVAKATATLRQAVEDAKAGIAKSEAASAKLTDWKDPAVEDRAKLGAQVAATERNIKKGERHVARKVQESEEHGEEVLEDEAQKLGMKVGDMTPLVDGAKKTMEATADKQAPVPKVVASKDAKGDLKSLEDNLAKANQKVKAVTDDANNKMDQFLKKTDSTVGDKRVKLEKDLAAAQKQEIAKVIGSPVAPPAAQTQSKPVPKEKAAPVAKTAAPIAKKK